MPRGSTLDRSGADRYEALMANEPLTRDPLWSILLLVCYLLLARHAARPGRGYFLSCNKLRAQGRYWRREDNCAG